ncbi:hypothetical protein [Siphonobacter sp. SORGH_AS_0500]|uniref:hypothetical protein n=1 Tax=Siphonobacter sp. SORGH_AS_0500 TaxID=1864824 RepID=UPI00285E28DE|nr:hypothetical protein [Siphonobacter sp. SORGH_AS_0500]MDR6197292.1 hypothetical protein [Siphonobacter sp. SORGH_AS_0500]
MSELFKNHILKIEYDPIKEFLSVHWLNCNEKVNFNQGLMQFNFYYNQLKPSSILWNFQEINQITHKEYDLIYNYSKTNIHNDFLKIALVLSDDTILDSQSLHCLIDFFKDYKLRFLLII